MRFSSKVVAVFVAVVIFIGGLVAFAQWNIAALQETFSNYRAQARQSLKLANLNEDLSEARLAVLKYRISDSEALSVEVQNNIKEITEANEEIDGVIRDEDTRFELRELEYNAREYAEIFTKATIEQNKRHDLVAQLDEIGPAIRKDITEIMETAYRDGDPVAAYYAGRVQERFMLARYHGRGFLVTNASNSAERTRAELADARRETAALLTELENPQRRALAASIASTISSYSEIFEQVVTAIETRNALYFEGLDKLGPQMLNRYDALFEKVETQQNTLGPQAVAEMGRISSGMLIVGLGIGALAALAAFVMGRALSRNLDGATHQMRRLADGDLAIEIDGVARTDEFGEMARTLTAFRDNAMEVERLQNENRAAAAREAEMRAQAMADIAAKFEADVGEIVHTVEQASKAMYGMAEQLTHAVDQTTDQSSVVAASSLQASSNVQTVAAAAEQMATAIKGIARNIADTSQMAKACAEAASKSKSHLRTLQTSVGDIDSVIQSINDVAEQTNLLALNATIEAARAGDAGKGFAVVASEVKSLANQTHLMTEQIAKKVADIKSSATGTISSVEDIIDQIGTVDEKATMVAAAIEQQNIATTQISANIHDAATGTDEVTRSITAVQKVAGDSSTATGRLKSSAKELSTQSAQLSTAVDAFLQEVRAA